MLYDFCLAFSTTAFKFLSLNLPELENFTFLCRINSDSMETRIKSKEQQQLKNEGKFQGIDSSNDARYASE